MRVFGLLLLLSMALGGHAEESERLRVSMIQLLMEPQSLVGHQVEVFGYLRNDELFLTRDHGKHSDHASALPIDATAGELFDKCNDRYVLLQARLVSENGRYRLTQIVSAFDEDTVSYCWEL